MPVNGCSSSTLPIQPPRIIPTQACTTGLSSRPSETPQSHRFTKRHDGSSSKTFPSVKPGDREFQQSLRSYPRSAKVQARSKLPQASCLRPSPVKAQVRVNLPQSSCSDPSPVKTSASPKPPLRPTPVRQQTGKRILYSALDAQRDIPLLTKSEALLAKSLQFNRKRLSDKEIKNMENLDQSIKTLLQAIKTADPTSPKTARFRRDTDALKSKVEGQLLDIGKKYVRETPPRPAIRKPPPPLTAVAIYRQKKNAARRDQNTAYRHEMWKTLAASDESREIHIQWKVNFPIDPELIQEKANTSPVAKEKTNESTLAGVRDSLNALREFLDDGDPLKIPSADDDSDPDTGYASQQSSDDSSPPISPSQTNQTIQDYWGNKETYRKEHPTFFRPWEVKETSSSFRSLRTPNLDPQGVFRATARNIPDRTTLNAGDTKEV